MSQTKLCFLGLPHGQWVDAVSVFQFPEACSVARDADPALLSQALERSSSDAQVRVVVVVEHPARALAAWLNGSGSDPLDEMAAKSLVAQAQVQLEALLQSAGARSMVVAVQDLLTDGEAFAEKLGQWLEMDVRASAAARIRPLDPVSLTLAARWVATDLGMTRTHERLQARCLVMVSAKIAPGSERPDSFSVVEQAVRHYGRMLAGAGVRPGVPAGGAAPSREAVLQAQLHETQAELETLYLSTAGAIDSAQAASGAARRRFAVTDEMRLLQRRNQLLQTQLHQVQEELEHYFNESQGLRKRPVGAALSTQSWVGVQQVVRTAARDAAPHRELSLTLNHVAATDRQHASLQVRLVEHHGRPGVLFFDTGTVAKPLMAWQPNGEEDSRSFMLLLPADDPSREVLGRLGSGDWRFVCGLSNAVMLHLREASGGVMTPWLMVATRLVRQLADLPQRFRFDGVQVSADDHQTDALRVTFNGPLFGSDGAERLELRWRPRSSGSAAVELLPTDARSALNLFAAWPLDPSGSGLAPWVLPVGGTDVTGGAAAWHALSTVDRGRLLALLDALPAAAIRVAQTDLAPAWQGVDLVGAAQSLFREGHRMVHGTRLKRVLRMAMGRRVE